jgi:hypothetical protein
MLSLLLSQDPAYLCKFLVINRMHGEGIEPPKVPVPDRLTRHSADLEIRCSFIELAAHPPLSRALRVRRAYSAG